MVQFLINLFIDHRKKVKKQNELKQWVKQYHAPVLGTQLNKWKETK